MGQTLLDVLFVLVTVIIKDIIKSLVYKNLVPFFTKLTINNRL